MPSKSTTELTCTTCGKTFHRANWQVKLAKRAFCSRGCYDRRAVRIERACAFCGTAFQPAITSPQAFCSRSCAAKSRKGDKAPGWKGGRITNDLGYVMIHKPEHPYGKSTGYVLEHRLVMEAHIGRFLHPDEKVHHINGNRSDNRIENLEVISQSEHMSLHMKDYHRQNPDFNRTKRAKS